MQLQHGTIPAGGKGLAYGSAGRCGEMDLTDSSQTERAFLKMSAVQQEVLMGLREDGCAPLLDKKHRPGLDSTFKILAQPACSLQSQSLG